jgi:DNA-binding NtrC family response regulator
VETATAAREAGVFDYLAKPFTLEHLVERVQAALKRKPPAPAALAAGPESMIIGSHPTIVEVYKAVARVAPLPLPVLITGETGTGKELVARALHRFGGHAEGPFVPLNCGAIPENLLESELFGHRKGAFTGAVRDHKGAIEGARGGTIFLDEVGELPPLLQVKLLRFLQDGEIRPVGGERGLQVPVRVVAATHRELQREVEAGRLREDFFYRLSAYEIRLPSLRERRSDIPLLVEHFRRRYQEELGGRDVPGPSEAALRPLAEHPWPGNVRELENTVQRALVDLGSLADAEGIRGLLAETPGGGDGDAATAPIIGSDLTLEELERSHIEAVLRRTGGNRTRTAAILGIERKSLYRKARRLGIDLGGEEEGP